MYRRGRGEYEELCDDECELYRYNIPPRYDGSRFRRSRSTAHSGAGLSENKCYDEHCVASVDISEPVSPAAENDTREEGQCDGAEQGSLISRLGISIGSEELLIIATALAIAGGDGRGDVLLLLALLLVAGD